MAQIDIRWKDPDTIFSVFSDINRKLILAVYWKQVFRETGL